MRKVARQFGYGSFRIEEVDLKGFWSQEIEGWAAQGKRRDAASTMTAFLSSGVVAAVIVAEPSRL